MSSIYTIYVLKLETNKYYVGKTVNPTYRLKYHFGENGSLWTRKYNPISIHELRPNRPATDEQIVTQEYMSKYGIENVRGGPWCKITLSEVEKQHIKHINQSNLDSCYKCGKSGHFSSNCRSKKVTNSVHRKVNVCERCGRGSHSTYKCYATTDIDGNYLLDNDDDDDDDDSSDDDDDSYEVWCCSRCKKEFDSEKGANYHERFYCNKVKSYRCKRCGRSGHNYSQCYATTDIRLS